MARKSGKRKERTRFADATFSLRNPRLSSSSSIRGLGKSTELIPLGIVLDPRYLGIEIKRMEEASGG